jgi:hypothetical protein
VVQVVPVPRGIIAQTPDRIAREDNSKKPRSRGTDGYAIEERQPSW